MRKMVQPLKPNCRTPIARLQKPSTLQATVGANDGICLLWGVGLLPVLLLLSCFRRGVALRPDALQQYCSKTMQ